MRKQVRMSFIIPVILSSLTLGAEEFISDEDELIASREADRPNLYDRKREMWEDRRILFKRYLDRARRRQHYYRNDCYECPENGQSSDYYEK